MTPELRTYFAVSALIGALASVVAGGLVLGLLWQYRQPVVNFLFSNGYASLGTTIPQLATSPGGVEQVVSKVSPAVVSVVIEKEVQRREQYFDDQEFERFLREGRLPVPKMQERIVGHQQIGGGSGVVVTADGYVLTNKHVVSDPQATYTALFSDGSKYRVEKIIRSNNADVALLKIDRNNLPAAKLGDSDQVRSGQTVVAIGNAMAEFQNSVSVGVVSGLNRKVVATGGGTEAEYLVDLIQTDAAINPGNSGGPLLNLAGEVIGINVAIAQGSENIGFALPINQVKAALNLD